MEWLTVALTAFALIVPVELLSRLPERPVQIVAAGLFTVGAVA